VSASFTFSLVSVRYISTIDVVVAQATKSGEPQKSSPSAAALPNAQAYYKGGLDYYNRGDADRSIADVTQAIRLNPQNAHAYFRRGIALSSKVDALIAPSLTTWGSINGLCSSTRGAGLFRHHRLLPLYPNLRGLERQASLLASLPGKAWQKRSAWLPDHSSA